MSPATIRVIRMLFLPEPKMFLPAIARLKGSLLDSSGKWFFLKLCEVMPLFRASRTVSFLYEEVAIREPMNTMTGIPMTVARSAATEIPEKPDRPIIIPDRALRGLLKKIPAATAAAVANMPMIICSKMHARRSSLAVYPVACRSPMFWTLSSMKFLMEKCMMITAMINSITVKINTIEVAMLVMPVVATFMVGRSMVKNEEEFGKALWTARSNSWTSAPSFILNIAADILPESSELL